MALCHTVQVYLFGHRNAATLLPVIELSVRSTSGLEETMSLSARHFIPVAANVTTAAISTYAQDVRPGDVVTVMANGKPSVGTVMAVRRSIAQGAFNPYTKVRVQTLACTATRQM